MSVNKVKEFREKFNMTQTELSRRTCIASQNLSAIERGKVEAWPKARRALAEVLGVSETELFPTENQAVC